MPQTLDDLPQESQHRELSHKNTSHATDDTPFYFHGNFKAIFQDQSKYSSYFNMEISDCGKVRFENDSFRYTGHAFISEGAILSIQITLCNQVPHSAQILAFVGRYPKDQIEWIKGSWHGLDETLTPSTKKIIIINSDLEVTDKLIMNIQNSKNKLSLII